MAVNSAFHTNNLHSLATERSLYQNLVKEAIQIYGHDVYYVNRETVALDNVLGEDALSKYTNAEPIEMYVEDAEGFGGDKENRIFSMLIRSYEIVEWKNKNALKVQVHGVSCNVSGAIGCYNILVASEKGIKKVEGPTPNPK